MRDTELSPSYKPQVPSGVRFHPPNVPLTPEIHWSLLRAFGPFGGASVISLSDPGAALSVVRRLGLFMRVFTRCPKQLLTFELTSPVFEESLRYVQSTAARGLALEQTLQTIDQKAASLKTRFVLIKGAAMAQSVGSSLSLRSASDVDVLCEQSDARRLHGAMKRHGYTEKTPTHPSYHLPMLVNAAGGALEIHTAIPYVSLTPKHSEVTLQQLLDAEFVEPTRRMSAYAYVPIPEFLLAHCLAHGIAQHGYIPHSYPLLRMLADAVDLGLTEQAGRSHVPHGLTSRFVSADEYAALRDAATALMRGDVESTWTDNAPRGRMLRHITLGALDQRYANGLKLFHALNVVRAFGMGAFLRDYGRATFGLANEDVARIYGAGARGQELGYKMARPLDVLTRILRMLPDTGRAAFARYKGRNYRDPG